jgi:peptide/nickel transport system substrate-binding protein
VAGFTRRAALASGLVAAAATPPRPALAQRGGAPRIIRAAMGYDISSLDPIANTSNASGNHGVMVYDTLLGMDERQQPQPQMVEGWETSDDRLQYRFTLRAGLRFHDESPVTTADVIPSIQRWARRSPGGQQLMQRVEAITAQDERRFTIRLKQRYGLLLDSLAGGVPLLFIMRKQEAETSAAVEIREVIGSGPFRYNRAESRTGTRYVYDRNPDYVPRSEPPSGRAGGKVVTVDRVIFINMPDAQTAVSALQVGEIDFYRTPPIELMDQLKEDRSIRLEVLDQVGLMGLIRLNFLHPPFDNVHNRQALLHIVDQASMMRPTFGNSEYARTCASYFACRTPLENDANTAWAARPDLAKARELLRQGGYDGRPVVILHITDVPTLSNATLVLAQSLRQAGINARLVPLDFATATQRRTSRAAPNEGGWNIFLTSPGAAAIGDPLVFVGHPANGLNGWFGWPSDERHEQLRSAWADSETPAQRTALAREMQDNAWTFVPHLYFGQWVQPVAYRANLRGFPHVADPMVWWNVEKA